MMKECKAPVFEKNSVWTCLILTIVYLLVIISLVLFIWIPGVPCLIKQYQFRIRNCAKGNSNSDIDL